MRFVVLCYHCPQAHSCELCRDLPTFLSPSGDLLDALGLKKSTWFFSYPAPHAFPITFSRQAKVLRREGNGCLVPPGWWQFLQDGGTQIHEDMIYQLLSKSQPALQEDRIHSFVHSFMQQLFIDTLLPAKHVLSVGQGNYPLLLSPPGCPMLRPDWSQKSYQFTLLCYY